MLNDVIYGVHIGVCERESIVYKHSAMMRRFGDLDRTTIKDGYNPMLEEYPNFSVMVSDSDQTLY